MAKFALALEMTISAERRLLMPLRGFKGCLEIWHS